MFDSTASEASAKAMGDVQIESLLRADSSWNNVPYQAYPAGFYHAAYNEIHWHVKIF